LRDARIALTDLMLDLGNPRHATVRGQRDAIQALLEDSEKLLALAKDIAEHGLNPLDVFLVAPGRADLFTVLEGNRRIAALKLLSHPELARPHPSEAKFRRLAATAELPEEVRCAVASSREEAQHWLELRHTGERGGAGVVPWSTEAQRRFTGHRGTQADRALAFADAVSQAYPHNANLQANIAKVRKERLTTLGRLVSDPYVRERMGVETSEQGLAAHYAPQELEPLLERVLADLAGTLTVSALKAKPQRRDYIDGALSALPTGANYQSDPQLLKSTPTAPKRRRRRPSASVSAKHILSNVTLSSLGSRVESVLDELKRLDVDQFPNTAAIVLRAVIELAVGQVHAEKGWTADQELRKRLQRCLRELDATGKDPKYQAIRLGLQDATSPFSIRTLHGYVHNVHFHATPTEVRGIAANYEPFLQDLDGLV
jgi:hypothetical protein